MLNDRDVGRVLEDLVETLEDSRRSFRAAADELAEAGHHELATQLREYASQRARFASELRHLAIIRSFLIEEGGSLAGVAHRGWMSLREAISGDKVATMLAAVEDGEGHARQEYDNALSEPLPADVLAVISRHASEIENTPRRLRELRAAAGG